MQLILQRRVSSDTSAAPDDIRFLKKAPNRLGYYLPNPQFGINKIADGAMIDALKQFQREHQLPSNGIITADDSTFKVLNDALATQPITQLQWHCAADENSCDACMAHDGTIVVTQSENTPNAREPVVAG